MIHIVISDFLADIVKRESGISPNIIYNGIDNSVFILKRDKGTESIFCINALFYR